MIPLLCANDVLRLDAMCAKELGIAPIDLMEQAASSASEFLLSFLEKCGGDSYSVLVACGGGNNGGDGYCIARLIASDTLINAVTVVTDVVSERMTQPTRTNHNRLPSNVKVISFGDLTESSTYDVVVDALIGVGGSAHLREPLPKELALLNRIVAKKVAIDVPTGLDSSTGEAHAQVFCADLTITMEAEKPGLLRNDGRRYAGDVVVAPIGIPDGYASKYASTFRYSAADVGRLLPERTRSTSKFDYGRVLIIGGSRGMPGAPSLSAHAALSSGAGLVELAAPFIHPLTPREVMPTVLASHGDGTIGVDARETLREMMQRATVCAIGPGLGTNDETHQMIAGLIDEMIEVNPIVIDADGLRMFPYILYRGPNLILTPHLGEFARLLTIDRSALPYDIIEAATRFAADHNVTLHVKDVPSVTTDGNQRILTTNGNAGMATAGSGDVLTGIIAALAAQGLAPFTAASLGAYLHAVAGDAVAHVKGQRSMLAGDIIRSL
ncbi:MAG: NAD(P)H-hydrate dehydratase [Candidatus Kapabacteria bacterium]|nr:NAD(P)H-hydrate dehydratase [Candidatus Kapabacteria bacterium]